MFRVEVTLSTADGATAVRANQKAVAPSAGSICHQTTGAPQTGAHYRNSVSIISESKREETVPLQLLSSLTPALVDA